MAIFGNRGVDEAVLSELRAIRVRMDALTDLIGKAATRDELDDYATKADLRAHLDQHKAHVEGWRFWLPYALMTVLGVFQLMQMAGLRVVLGH